MANSEAAEQNYYLAARLGHVMAMGWYGKRFAESDPRRWHWFGRALRRGDRVWFLQDFVDVVNDFSTDSSLAPCVFEIGRVLKDLVDVATKKIWNHPRSDLHFGSAMQAMDFFSFQCAAARKAVDVWCLIARRILGNTVNKDIRRKIGQLIWEARELALYRETMKENDVVE